MFKNDKPQVRTQEESEDQVNKLSHYPDYSTIPHLPNLQDCIAKREDARDKYLLWSQIGELPVSPPPVSLVNSGGKIDNDETDVLCYAP